jgi:hypothetical protein
VRPLRALLLGLAAGTAVTWAAAATVALVASAGEVELALGLGGLRFLAVEQGADGSSATFGPGLALVPLLAGLANAAAAAVLAARAR